MSKRMKPNAQARRRGLDLGNYFLQKDDKSQQDHNPLGAVPAQISPSDRSQNTIGGPLPLAPGGSCDFSEMDHLRDRLGSISLGGHLNLKDAIEDATMTLVNNKISDAVLRFLTGDPLDGETAVDSLPLFLAAAAGIRSGEPEDPVEGIEVEKLSASAAASAAPAAAGAPSAPPARLQRGRAPIARGTCPGCGKAGLPVFWLGWDRQLRDRAWLGGHLTPGRRAGTARARADPARGIHCEWAREYRREMVAAGRAPSASRR